MAWVDAVQSIDEAILRAGHGSPSWAVPAFFVLTMLGGGWGLLVLVPFVLRSASRRATFWLLGCEFVTSALVVPLLKWIIGRMRPCATLAWSNPLWIPCPNGPSFPSGHAAGSFAFAVFVALRVPRFGPAALVFATLIAWSRCMLGVHYPSDVLVGSVLGGALGAGFAIAGRRHDAAAILKKEAPALLQPGSQGQGAAEADSVGARR